MITRNSAPPAPQFTNISLRVTTDQAEFVKRWARHHGRTVSDLGWEVLSQWAASDLQEPVPGAPRPQRASRPPSPITAAAAARGMTRDSFRQWAAELVAEADLRRGIEPTAGTGGSGEHPIARIPMIAIRPPASAGRYRHGGKGG